MSAVYIATISSHLYASFPAQQINVVPSVVPSNHGLRHCSQFWQPSKRSTGFPSPTQYYLPRPSHSQKRTNIGDGILLVFHPAPIKVVAAFNRKTMTELTFFVNYSDPIGRMLECCRYPATTLADMTVTLHHANTDVLRRVAYTIAEDRDLKRKRSRKRGCVIQDHRNKLWLLISECNGETTRVGQCQRPNIGAFGKDSMVKK